MSATLSSNKTSSKSVPEMKVKSNLSLKDWQGRIQNVRTQ